MDEFKALWFYLPDPDAECHEEDQFEGTPQHTYADAHLFEDEISKQREVRASLGRIQDNYSEMLKVLGVLDGYLDFACPDGSAAEEDKVRARAILSKVRG